MKVERIEAMKATLKFARQMWADHMTLGKLDPEPPAFAIVEQMITEATTADVDPAAKAALALEIAVPAHIEGLMALSTAHVSKTTADHLQLNSLDVVRYEHGDYGWLIHVPSDQDFWAPVQAKAQAGEFQTDLFDVMDYARRHGCCWLLLDADADRVAGLLTFDW
jgi:hypothetical protein